MSKLKEAASCLQYEYLRMLRVALINARFLGRSLQPVARPNLRQTLTFVRFNHKLPDFWTAPTVTYEQVKPRTEQPSPVRHFVVSLRLHAYYYRMHT